MKREERRGLTRKTRAAWKVESASGFTGGFLLALAARGVDEEKERELLLPAPAAVAAEGSACRAYISATMDEYGDH